MKTHARSGVMGRKRIRVFSFSLRLIYIRVLYFFSCYLVRSPTDGCFFSWPVRFGFSCGASKTHSVAMVRSDGWRRPRLVKWLATASTLRSCLSEFPNASQTSWVRCKRETCPLLLAFGHYRLLSSSLRRHPSCHGKKAKETGGGSKIAQNPCLSQKQQRYANQHEKNNAS